MLTAQEGNVMVFKLLAFSLVSLMLQLGAALAACEGRDLLAAMPAAERAALQARAEAHPHAEGNFFRATRGEEVIHLLGTLHLPDPRHDAILQRVAAPLQKASLLLVEADPKQEARLKSEIVKRPEFMFLTEGPKLNKLLSEAEWKTLAARMQEHGIPPLVSSRFRPWYLAVMLGMPPCASESLKAGGKGLDHRLMAQAENHGLPIASLEPFDTLFKIFGDLTLEEELEMVRAAMLATVNPEDSLATTVNGYFAGDTRLLWEFTRDQALATPGAKPEEVEAQFALMEEVLMTKRNHAWIPVITGAAEKGPVFAAFGALHLPGKDGVLALLEAEGFTITRLD